MEGLFILFQYFHKIGKIFKKIIEQLVNLNHDMLVIINCICLHVYSINPIKLFD